MLSEVLCEAFAKRNVTQYLTTYCSLCNIIFQLLDLRQVIARMLGLDVNQLAVPDYEIISRLEKLFLAQQSHTATTVALDSALENMEDGFRAGYENATHVLGTKSMLRSGSLNRSGTRTRQSRLRTRSASPARKNKDTRAY